MASPKGGAGTPRAAGTKAADNQLRRNLKRAGITDGRTVRAIVNRSRKVGGNIVTTRGLG